MKLLKWLKRIFVVFLVIFSLGLGTIAVLGTVYEEEVKTAVVTELAKNLVVPIGYDKINFSLIKNFPKASIEITKVNIQSFTKNDPPLAKVEKVYLLFDLSSILSKNYTVDEIKIETGEVNVAQNKLGHPNYQIWKSDTSASSGNSSFQLKEVGLTDLFVSYSDFKRNQFYHTYSDNTVLYPSFDEGFALEAFFEGKVRKINLEAYKIESEVDLSSKITLSVKNDIVNVETENAEIAGQKVKYKGQFDISNNDQMEMDFEAENANLEKLKGALSKEVKELVGSNSNGEITVKGKISSGSKKKTNNELSVNYEVKNGVFESGENKLSGIQARGVYNQKKLDDVSSGEVQLDTYSFNYKGSNFKGQANLKNLNSPVLEGETKSVIDLKKLKEDHNLDKFDVLEGELELALKLKVKVKELLNSGKSSGLQKSTGEVSIKNVKFKIKDESTVFSGINGKLNFNNSDLTFEDLYGDANNLDFRLKGKILSYLETISGKKPLTIQADLFAGDMVLESFISEEENTTSDSAVYEFNLPKNVDLSFNIDLNKFSFRKFEAEKIKGGVRLKNGKLTCNNISFNSCEGTALVNGSVTDKGENDIIFEVKADLKKLNTKKAFYQLENFGQDFLKSEHVAGKVNTNIYFLAHSDKQLNLKEDKIYSETDIEVLEGELSHFEPLMELQKFLAEDGFEFDLTNLKFKTLNNNIQIVNRVVYIPEMKIRTNSVNFDLEGQHSFDQNVRYLFKVKHSELFKDNSKSAIDQQYGVYSDDRKSPTEPVLMYGNVDDLKFAYDIKTKGQIINDNVKKEGQEVKKILQKELNSILGKEDTIKIEEKKKPIKVQVNWDEESDEEGEGESDDF